MTIKPQWVSQELPTYNQQDATFLDLFISTDAVHVSGGSYTHHQEHKTVHTASGIVNQYCCWLQPAAVLVDNTWSCMYSYVLLMMGGGTAWNMQSFIVDELELTSYFHLIHDSSKQQYWLTINEAVYIVMCSWWWAEEPPEKRTASVEINKSRNVASCWL